MRVNEVRKTETIEKLVRTEYIAEDGTVFRSEEQIEKEIKEAEEELAKVQSNLEDDLDDDELTTEERAEIIDGYQPDIDEIKERIADLNEELENI